MNKEWRPKDWDTHKLLIETVREIKPRDYSREALIDYGASAMLKAIREELVKLFFPLEDNRMDFNAENKVIIESMTRIEAKAFVRFLQSEISRHKRDIDEAVALIYTVVNKFHIGGVLEE